MCDSELQEAQVPDRAALPPIRMTPVAPPGANPAAIGRVADMLLAATKPVIVADRAARTPEGMRLLVQFAELLNAPVIDQGGRHVEPTTLIDHGSIEQLRELDEQAHALRGARRAIGDDHRLRRRKQHVGDAPDRRGIGSRRRNRRHPDRRQRRTIRYLRLLQFAVAHQQDRAVGGRSRDLHRALEGFAIMRQAHRRIVPLHIITDEGAQIGGAVQPLDPRAPFGVVERVADDHHHRRPIAPGVVDRHRGMLQADGRMDQAGHRLPGRLGITVRDPGRYLLVHADDQLGRLVMPVIDDRFVQAAEGRSRGGRDIADVGAMQQIDHIIRTGCAGGLAAAIGLDRNRSSLGLDLRAGRGERIGGSGLPGLGRREGQAAG